MAFSKCLLLMLMVAFATDSAHADDARCNAPPYGGSSVKYRAFTETVGQALSDPNRVLSAICNQKFGGRDRGALYTLGFTDAQIDSQDTADLAYAVMAAIRKM